MARDVVNEASSCSLRVRFYDEDGAAKIPTTVHWRIRDLTNCRVIQDWTQVTTGSSVDLEITATMNAISGGCHAYQEHVVSVQADQGLETQFSDEQRYVVANLQGFTS